ncbi:Uncharacterised protein [Streptococcus pasteurianus]|nr:Uncharacterised protein [Streptococcus pasteurianus]
MRLKWFAGCKERRDKALIILDKLIASFHNNYGVQPLTDLFLKYKGELKNGRTRYIVCFESYEYRALACIHSK